MQIRRLKSPVRLKVIKILRGLNYDNPILKLGDPEFSTVKIRGSLYPKVHVKTFCFVNETLITSHLGR